MSRKTVYFGLATILILSAAIILIGGLGWGQKAPAGVGNLPVRDGSLEQGKTGPAMVNAKARTLSNDFGKVPIFFVPNRGQTDDQVVFYVKGADKTVYFASDGVTFAMNYPARSGNERESERWVVKLDFLDARKDVEPEGVEKTGAVLSYFRGKPEEWKTGLPAYSRIIYRDLWPGIDLAYKGEMDKLKYEFIIHAGSDPSKIRLAYRGAEKVVLTAEGRLEVKTPVGGFEDDIPVAYQEVDGRRAGVPVTYSLEDVAERQSSAVVSGPRITPAAGPENRTHFYGFVVGEYDRSRTLVLDPAVIVYCGYIGGPSDQGYIGGGRPQCGIAVDDSGNAYISGQTSSNELTFPVTVGPDLTYNGDLDIFIAKVDPSGASLVYCGYIGGAGTDDWSAIAVDDLGNVYVTGFTTSTEATFPVMIGPDLTHNGGRDAFIAKANASGTGLDYCGYIGGINDDEGLDIVVDEVGNAYVSGRTTSTEVTFPAKVGPDLTHNGGRDAFVAKVNASGTGLDYCGYIGGSGEDDGSGIAIDQMGNAFVSGNVWSTEATFPVKVGPDLTHNGGGDVYVAKVDSSGIGLDYCGYIGGSTGDAWSEITVDDSGNAYIAGSTTSSQSTFPVVVGPDLTYNGAGDSFVAKVESSGTALVYCGYIGGSGREEGTGIALDSSGNVFITGFTNSSEATFPVVDGPDLTYNGGFDAFVTKVDSSGTAVVYCGYIGGVNDDVGHGIALDASGNAYITGNAASSEATFPVTVGPDLTINGPRNTFVAKVGDIPGPPITSLLPDSAEAGDPGFLLSVIGSDFVNGAVVRWGGSARPTTFVSEFEVDATIDASDLAAGRTVQVTVRNPDGGVSNALPFTIDNPLPSLASLSTTHVTGGGAAFTLTVQGSSFVPNSVVRWNGSARATTYVSATELQAAITATDIATGGVAQVTVFNPAPAGGASGALALQVSTYTLASTPASVTVTAGQSATYTVQMTPQYGSFDSAVTFTCAGLPSKCAASFAPASATPGAAAVSTILTLTTAATSSSTGAAGASFFGITGFGPPTLGLLAFVMTLFLGNAIRRRFPWRLSRRWLAVAVLICLVIVIGSCSAGGGDNNPPPYTGTPKGTHQISVQGTSENMTVPTVVTLVVN